MNENDTLSYPNAEQKSEFEEMLGTIPDDLFKKGMEIREALAGDELAPIKLMTWALVNAARDAMPKGTFVIWDNTRGEYVAYVRDEEGKDVEPPISPVYGKTTTQAITRAMIAYYGGQR